MWHWLQKKWLSPQSFYKTSGYLLPWIVILFAVFFGFGLITGLFIAPADYQQGDGFRIIYVHVPSAFASMAIFMIMGFCGVLTLVWRIKIAAICMHSSSVIGAWFTFLALVTGSIWGKPMWGTFWVWDARLTSVLILFFLYLGFIALQSIIVNTNRRDFSCSILAIVGIINLPIIHYSVIWWNTLHQGPSISRFATPTIAFSMLYPLIVMIFAFFIFYILLVLLRMRNLILIREINTDWVKDLC